MRLPSRFFATMWAVVVIFICGRFYRGVPLVNAKGFTITSSLYLYDARRSAHPGGCVRSGESQLPRAGTAADPVVDQPAHRQARSGTGSEAARATCTGGYTHARRQGAQGLGSGRARRDRVWDSARANTEAWRNSVAVHYYSRLF